MHSFLTITQKAFLKEYLTLYIEPILEMKWEKKRISGRVKNEPMLWALCEDSILYSHCRYTTCGELQVTYWTNSISHIQQYYKTHSKGGAFWLRVRASPVFPIGLPQFEQAKHKLVTPFLGWTANRDVTWVRSAWRPVGLWGFCWMTWKGGWLMLSPSPLLYRDQLIKNSGGFEVWQGEG